MGCQQPTAREVRGAQDLWQLLGASLLELEESDVPANYVVRLRAEQAGLRKSLLRVYHIQREQFLSRSASSPSSSSTCCGC